MARSMFRLAALYVVLCGSTMASASKVSCPDTTESSASSALGPSTNTSSANSSTSDSSNGSGSSASSASLSASSDVSDDILASVQASEATSTSPHVTIYDQANFGGVQIEVWLDEAVQQSCINVNCMSVTSFSWGGWDEIDTNGSIYLSAFPEGGCQGGDLGTWQLAANEFPAQLDPRATSYGVWQGEPVWNHNVYGCGDGFTS